MRAEVTRAPPLVSDPRQDQGGPAHASAGDHLQQAPLHGLDDPLPIQGLCGTSGLGTRRTHPLWFPHDGDGGGDEGLAVSPGTVQPFTPGRMYSRAAA